MVNSKERVLKMMDFLSMEYIDTNYSFELRQFILKQIDGLFPVHIKRYKQDFSFFTKTGNIVYCGGNYCGNIYVIIEEPNLKEAIFKAFEEYLSELVLLKIQKDANHQLLIRIMNQELANNNLDFIQNWEEKFFNAHKKDK